MYIQYFFFLIVFFEYKKHACKKIIQVYFVNIVNPDIFIVYPNMYIYIYKNLWKRLL